MGHLQNVIKNMYKKTFIVLGVLIIAYLLIHPGSQNQDVIKVGYVGPLTGDVSSLGIPTLKAVEMAISEANGQGGINGRKIELIAEDGACNSKTALDAGNKLINVDNVVAIIGGFCSGETSAFGPGAMKNKTLVISPASSLPSLSSLGKYFFRVYPSDQYQGKFTAQYLYNTMGVRKVAILYSNTDWGINITNVFKKEYESLGGRIVFNEGLSQDTRDFRTVIGKIKESQAELLFVPQYTESSLAFVKQFTGMGVNMKIFGADAWADSKFQKEVSPYVYGTKREQILYVEAKTGSDKDFASRFMKVYPGEKIGVGVAQGYDATRVLIESMKISGVENREMLADTIRKTNFKGVSNQISFDQNGDLMGAEYVVKRILSDGSVEEMR